MLHRENKITVYRTSSAVDLLKETIDYYHITQSDLAERLGVSQKHISELLNRKSFMDEKTALLFQKVLGTSGN